MDNIPSGTPCLVIPVLPVQGLCISPNVKHLLYQIVTVTEVADGIAKGFTWKEAKKIEPSFGPMLKDACCWYFIEESRYALPETMLIPRLPPENLGFSASDLARFRECPARFVYERKAKERV